uniref:NADH-ubiquinone oxidoreductase chain 6 n=1 Tax=Agrilus ornatus TaxID=2951065 RepID=A0A8X8M164_9COLE|nr:NADH dehydrogenase subunit 6 [Agrilus ornatus]URW97765.1 NADH dehydrogenase subunit 6 [Agrilus ornatus]
MLIIMILSILISLMFFFTKHPLSMGFNLLLQTVIMALMAGLLNINFWYSFILFLIMVGGMLILFIYMTSVASNEKFKFSTEIFGVMLIILTMLMTINLIADPMSYIKETLTVMTDLEMSPNMWTLSLNKFLTYPLNMLLLLMMSYLFLTLVAVVKITEIKSGPLRTFKKH